MKRILLLNFREEIIDRVLQIEDQFIVTNELIHVVAVAEVVQDIQDPF